MLNEIEEDIQEIEKEENQDLSEENVDYEIEPENSVRDNPKTNKVSLSADFLNNKHQEELLQAEIENQFCDEIISGFKQNASHFKLINVKNPNLPLFGKFKWYAVYFDSDTRICTIIFIQPIPLLGIFKLNTRIDYQPISQISCEKINELLQTEILEPYTDYKNIYETLEDQEPSDFNSALESALKPYFRKCRIIKTANSFSIEFQKFRYSLEMKAFFPLRCQLDYSGKNIYPGIPPIKLYFIPFERRNLWYELLPHSESKSDCDISSNYQNSSQSFQKFQKFWNKCLSLIFCCGIMQIISSFIDSLMLFWSSAIIILVTVIVFCITYLRFIRTRNFGQQSSPVGINHPSLTSHPNSITKANIKAKVKVVTANPQTKQKSLNVSTSFAKQSISEFLN
jgi:hypothetical protein